MPIFAPIILSAPVVLAVSAAPDRAPRQYEDRSIRLEVPAGWVAEPDDRDDRPGIETMLSLSRPDDPEGFSAFVILLQTEHTPEMMLDNLRSSWSGQGFALTPDREADEYAGHSGLLEEGALARKSELHRYRFFAGPVAPNWLIVTQFCADGDRAAAYFASADELMRSLEITPPPLQAPDLAGAASLDRGVISLRRPGNWLVMENDESDPRFAVALDLPQDAFVRVDVYESSRTPAEEIEASRRLLADVGVHVKPESRELDALGPLQGFGIEAPATADATSLEYTARLLIVPLGKGWVAEVHEFFPSESAELITPGLELVRETLRLARPDQVEPVLDPPGRVARGPLAYEHPRNWIVSHGEAPDADHAHDAIDSACGTQLEIFTYPAERSLEEEISATLDLMLDEHEPVGEPKPVERWGGFEGRGFRLVHRDETGNSRLTCFVAPAGDGRTIEIWETVPVDAVERAEPGLDLIRGTLELREPPAPAADVQPSGRPRLRF